jgi:hypothetical protein
MSPAAIAVFLDTYHQGALLLAAGLAAAWLLAGRRR